MDIQCANPYYTNCSKYECYKLCYIQKIMTDVIDNAAKKMKNADQDARAKAQTAEDHAKGKPSSETLNKAEEKVKDALS